MEPDPDRYFLKLAAAFVRGRYAMGDAVALEDKLRAKRLDDLSEQELARRRESWKPPDQSELRGWLARYANMATSANQGAVLEID